MVARRERLDASKARALTSPREHDVSIEPRPPWRQLGKGHPYVERNAALFGQDFDWADVTDGVDDGIKERADFGRLPRKVVLEIVAPARMRLIAVRELAAAALAAPERRAVQGLAREASIPDTTATEAAALVRA